MDGEDHGPDVRYLEPGIVALGFGSIARFVISFPARTVRLVSAHAEADQGTIDHLVDDHIAPRIIAADGTLVLHGSAAVVGSQVVAFLGETGSGKSTFGASMHAAGHRLLGDDAVVISEEAGVFVAESVYPSLRLYRESIDQVLREDVETSAMAFYSDKVRVSAPDLDSAGPGRYPLGAVYFLTKAAAGVKLELMYPSDSCISMVENSFALDPFDQEIAVKRMAQAARIASAVPCYDLVYPHDFSSLAEARAQVVASLAALSAPA